MRPDRAGGPELLDRLSQALRQDEIHVKLGARIRDLAKEALILLRPPAPSPLSAGRETRSVPASARGRSEAQAALMKLVRDVEAAIEQAGDELELSGSVQVSWRKKP